MSEPTIVPQPEVRAKSSHHFFAYDLLDGFLTFLDEHRDHYRAITYKDFLWPEATDLDRSFAEEWSRWNKVKGAISAAERRSYCLIQYDVDRDPEATHQIVRRHLDLGIPANVMVFNPASEGVGDYKLDIPLLQDFEKMGGVVGYHSNAGDRVKGGGSELLRIFEEDLAALREHFDIRFFSPHSRNAALLSPNSGNEHVVGSEMLARLGLRWVHNGHSPSYHSAYSDGGIRKRFASGRGGEIDLPGYARMHLAKPGRHRVLIHPQYYAKVGGVGLDEMANSETVEWFARQRKQLGAGRAVRSATTLSGRSFLGQRARRLVWEPALTPWTEWRLAANEVLPEREMEKSDEPIFIHGMSRSGTTLVTTVFDAHPSYSLSYEIYPKMLLGDGAAMLKLGRILAAQDEAAGARTLDERATPAFKTFCLRAGRGGVTLRDLGLLMLDHERSGGDFDSLTSCMRFVGGVARLKMVREGNRWWGAKSTAAYGDYLAYWPKARFIYTLRDPRDILASQQNNGAFKPDARQLGETWQKEHRMALDFQRQHPHHLYISKYERLSADPETVLRELCEELKMDYSEDLLRFHTRSESTLRKNPKGHLSAHRVAMPIDSASVGRWQKDLSAEDLEAVQAGASPLLAELGY